MLPGPLCRRVIRWWGWWGVFSWGRGKINPAPVTLNTSSDVHEGVTHMDTHYQHGCLSITLHQLRPCCWMFHQINWATMCASIWRMLRKALKCDQWWIWSLQSSFPFWASKLNNKLYNWIFLSFFLTTHTHTITPTSMHRLLLEVRQQRRKFPCWHFVFLAQYWLQRESSRRIVGDIPHYLGDRCRNVYVLKQSGRGRGEKDEAGREGWMDR